jgi:ATP-dependent DNA ligase
MGKVRTYPVRNCGSAVAVTSPFHFIPPCSPIRVTAVPAGDGWVHEVKFDGYRVQAHKVGARVIVFSRNGHDFTERFPSIVKLLRDLPAKSAVLDGEVVASDTDGRPNFARLHVRWTRPNTLHLWAFDLLVINGHDVRSQPLVSRQACLEALLERFGCPTISLSESFEDGLALLRAAEARGLEGIVSKRRDASYRSGECRDWRKVKTTAWRKLNADRWRLFERNWLEKRSRSQKLCRVLCGTCMSKEKAPEERAAREKFEQSLREIEAAAPEIVKVGHLRFGGGERSDPALLQPYRLYTRVMAARPVGPERVAALGVAMFDERRKY